MFISRFMWRNQSSSVGNDDKIRNRGLKKEEISQSGMQDKIVHIFYLDLIA